MTAVGAAMVAYGFYHCLIVATSKRDFRRGMHVPIWGSALVITGRVK